MKAKRFMKRFIDSIGVPGETRLIVPVVESGKEE